MHAKLWISHLRKFLRFKKSPLKSPRMLQVAAISVVVLITVAGLVLAAHQAVVPAAAPQPAARPVARPVATSATTTAPGKKAAVPNAKGNATVALTPVTITGCLEQNHDSFRLKDTSGADAPKSRSWKSGFLGKHAKTITIVDSGNRLKLGSHVGERVSVTGTLVDKEMQGRSLKRETPSCE